MTEEERQALDLIPYTREQLIAEVRGLQAELINRTREHTQIRDRLVAEERERCARLVEEEIGTGSMCVDQCCARLADAIRAPTRHKKSL